MPAKIDRCVKHVMAQGKSKDSAYAMCVKSTGIVKTGKHTWEKKKTPVSEAATIKIGQLIQEANDERFPKGIYVEAKFDPGALQKIWGLLKKIGFKNMLPVQRAHATIIYSPRAPNKTFKQTPINGFAEPSHFEILGGNRGKPHLLVLVLKSRELDRKHKEYMKEYQLKSTYREYKPHLTIVYDLKRLLPGFKAGNTKAKESMENMFNLLIKDMPRQIRIHKEEVSELSKDWQ